MVSFNNIETSARKFAQFAERGKTKIVKFYNSNCNFVISRAEQLANQGRKNESAEIINSVPKTCADCYGKSRKVLESQK